MTRVTNDITAAWTARQGAAGYQGVSEIIDAAGEQQRSHLAMWAMMAAPLIAGNDLAEMSSGIAQLLATPGVSAIDQDPLGRAGATPGPAGLSRPQPPSR